MNQEIIQTYQIESSIFKSMAHPIRLFIIHQLENKKYGVQELADMAEVDISTMSRHLDTLKRHRIIVGEKIKNNVFYTLNIPCVLEFMTCTNKVINQQNKLGGII